MSCEAHELAASRALLNWEDVDLIQEMVEALPLTKPVRVLDLGAGSGTTALAVFCVRPTDVAVITVDHNQEALDSVTQLLTNYGYIDKWVGMLGDTCQVKLGGQFDMLMIDSSHEYEQTLCELKRWLPMLVPEGLLWLHDYRGKVYPGVKRALDEWPMPFEVLGVKGLSWGGRLL